MMARRQHRVSTAKVFPRLRRVLGIKRKPMPATKVFPNVKATGPTIEDVAELIKENKAKNIIVLVGAGISTSAGIPDFRSPETGLYSNLAQYNLPYPEAIFDLSYFFQRPEAFFTLAKEIYPGNYLPTLTHYFFVLLQKKGLLKRLFSQNVDTLERLAGINDELIVEAHGSFATAHCLKCREAFKAEALRHRIARGEVLRCQKDSCKGSARALIKSDIVFFGESLPERFFKRLGDFDKCDLLITIGTSLKVQPFASLIDRVDDDCPRLLINLESVGEIDEYEAGGMFGNYREEGFDFEGGTRGGKEYIRDVRWLGQSDEGIKELAKLLGWEEELLELYHAGHKDLKEKDLQTRDVPRETPEPGSAKKEAEIVAAEVAKEIQKEPVAPEEDDSSDSSEDASESDEKLNEKDEKVDELADDLQKLDVNTAATKSAEESRRAEVSNTEPTTAKKATTVEADEDEDEDDPDAKAKALL